MDKKEYAINPLDVATWEELPAFAELDKTLRNEVHTTCSVLLSQRKYWQDVLNTSCKYAEPDSINDHRIIAKYRKDVLTEMKDEFSRWYFSTHYKDIDGKKVEIFPIESCLEQLEHFENSRGE